ncbi:hypothetical protein FB45DRAFT_1038044 [Roridomyces roridus]|uniref:Cyanovirin-N domain-containing protein n=1 Tax=Roridomyces roridus TaxID=1738132 RepID=A0AAD7FBQ4_9AGAR|nr:hypothetical protein FB45DRAFT_1038044 [Roridomyces roridus]
MSALLFSLILLAAAAHATPIKRDSITTVCVQFQLSPDGHTFACSPQPGLGQGQVTIGLANCIQNNDGVLIASGGGFIDTCDTVVLSGTSLSAHCISVGAGGIREGSSVDLDEILNFENGQLSCPNGFE